MKSLRSFNTSRLLPLLPFVVITLSLLIFPHSCFADFGQSLERIKNTMTGTVLPALSIIGLVIAAISFFTGNPMAKQHIVYAILGCCFGFGAQVIVDLIRSTVR